MVAHVDLSEGENRPFRAALGDAARRVEAFLKDHLSAQDSDAVGRLIAAMRHGTLNGGKRFRPFLLIESARLFGIEGDTPLRAGAALECVHCYSLIHDDLPAMDDDDLRRGQPTVHIAFDEATAILAGDALLTTAFDILADPDTHPDAELRCRLISELTRASGWNGMAGGQALDLAAEVETQTLGEADVRRLQRMKTGALIRYAIRAGGLIGGADATALDALTVYAEALGLAFQISDDLLDAEGATQTLGKRAGKDEAAGKATFVSLYGVDGARERLSVIANEAIAALGPFGAKADVFRETVTFVTERKA